MKKLYPLASLLLGSLILTSTSQAQTYSGGTYTAVRNGNWHVTSGPNVWDVSGEPPANCSNCSIVINAVVHLNTSVTLTNASLLSVTGGSGHSKLYIDNSGGADWASSFNILLYNDGSNPVNQIKTSNGGTVDATNADNDYDGVFAVYLASTPYTYFKAVGNGASAYSGTNVAYAQPASTNTLNNGSTVTSTGTLPIILSDFEAAVDNGVVGLNWRTMLESNASYFNIERSADGVKWDVIGTVKAKGNSSTPTNYSFSDGNPGSGTIEYRIHEYDLDGRPMLSNVKAIRTAAIANVSVFPNPATNYVNISIPTSENSPVNMRLIDLAGHLLVEKNVSGAGGTIQTFTVSNYPPGNYLIQVLHADGTKQINKVLIARN